MCLNERLRQGKTYDVFISHKSDCKPWVRILAKNLKTQGFKVFLDEWELVPGKDFIEGLSQGIRLSRKGVLVVTPGAYESGWVRDEYSQMMIQKQEDRDFSIIPVVLGEELPVIPFLNSILWVDFRDADRYRESFYYLVCALKNSAPGPEVDLQGELTLPTKTFIEKIQLAKNEVSFIEELFDLISAKQAVLLLVQRDRWQEGVKTDLLERARKEYGKENVMHMVPPFSPNADLENYFSLLGKQCGIYHSVNNSVSLGAAFEGKLAADSRLFLMVSGFENSCKEGQEELAGVLRGLNERYSHNLKILICGGEKLDELSYNGELSYLNHAYIQECPELTVSDVLRITEATYPDTKINEKKAAKLLHISGGHHRILEICLDLCRQNPDFTAVELTEVLHQSPFIWQLFTPFSQDTEIRQQVCSLLNKEDVGPGQPYIYDPLLRRLYWRNLLRRGSSNRRLYWRCKALRQVGLQILRCEKSNEV
jgi:hypothetical protein